MSSCIVIFMLCCHILTVKVKECFMREILSVLRTLSTFTELRHCTGITKALCFHLYILKFVPHSSRLSCPIAFSRELAYWGISDLYLEPCCQKTYQRRKEMMKKAKQMQGVEIYQFPKTRLGKIRQWWWNLLEFPTFSILSRVVAFISCCFVLLSSIVLVASMVMEDKNREEECKN